MISTTSWRLRRRNVLRSRKNDSDESAYDDEVYNEAAYDEEEKPDLSLTANLPEIDLSALDEAEKEAEKAAEPEDTDEDLDIEILDLDDLNL